MESKSPPDRTEVDRKRREEVRLRKLQLLQYQLCINTYAAETKALHERLELLSNASNAYVRLIERKTAELEKLEPSCERSKSPKEKQGT